MKKNGELMSSAKPPHCPPQLKKALELSEMAGNTALILEGLSFFGIGGRQVKEWAETMKNAAVEGEKLVQLPQQFNARFQEHGWLYSDSTSVDAATKAIELFEEGKLEEANDLLCTQFEEDNLDFLFIRLKTIPEFLSRYDIARSAASLCKAKQYTGAVPLIFIVIDGMATDALGKSIFSEGIDVSEEKALAGNIDGFPSLISKVCKTRRRTNTDEITFPYRNGIIHGKDVNFGNRLVTAKCWSILSCFGDILRAKKLVCEPEGEDSRSLLQILKKHSETKKFTELLNEWQPRSNISFLPSCSYTQQAFTGDDPEAALCRFFDYWREKNYGKMGELTVYNDNRPIKKRAGQIREDISEIEFVDATIVKIEDKAAAVTEITCRLEYNLTNQKLDEEFCFRLLYLDQDMNILARFQPGGTWRVFPSYLGWAIGVRFR